MACITGYIGQPRVNHNSCELSFNGSWFVKALQDFYGIHPRKTFDISISDKIPKEMMSNYLRGYFDGDGTITYMRNYPHIAFTSGSNKMLEQIVDYFYANGIVIRNKTGKPKIYESSQAINYFCKNAVSVLDILYEGSTPITRLDRKYSLYLGLKEVTK